VNKWSVVGALMVLLGVAILILLASFLVAVIVVLLEFIAVAIGIFLILGGLALLFGRRWMRRRWDTGQHPAST
jgi:membrane protein implicated in regulation of membrane protease activity